MLGAAATLCTRWRSFAHTCHLQCTLAGWRRCCAASMLSSLWLKSFSPMRRHLTASGPILCTVCKQSCPQPPDSACFSLDIHAWASGFTGFNYSPVHYTTRPHTTPCIVLVQFRTPLCTTQYAFYNSVMDARQHVHFKEFESRQPGKRSMPACFRFEACKAVALLKSHSHSPLYLLCSCHDHPALAA